MAAIRNLPSDTPAEFIINEIVALEYNVINVLQMSANPRNLWWGKQTSDFILFLITLEWTEKSQDIL